MSIGVWMVDFIWNLISTSTFSATPTTVGWQGACVMYHFPGINNFPCVTAHWEKLNTGICWLLHGITLWTLKHIFSVRSHCFKSSRLQALSFALYQQQLIKISALKSSKSVFFQLVCCKVSGLAISNVVASNSCSLSIFCMSISSSLISLTV